MESRGGARGKPDERNTDYLTALDALLQRLSDRGVDSIRVHIVSSRAMAVWEPEARAIQIEGKTEIPLASVNIKELRKKYRKPNKKRKRTQKVRVAIQQSEFC